MGPNFCYAMENISFWGCQKQEKGAGGGGAEWQNFNYIREWNIFLQAMVWTHAKHWTYISNSISKSNMFCHNISISKHTCIQHDKVGYFQQWWALKQDMLICSTMGCERNQLPQGWQTVFVFFLYQQSNAGLIMYSMQEFQQTGQWLEIRLSCIIMIVIVITTIM